jgi:hypothetical protein
MAEVLRRCIITVAWSAASGTWSASRRVLVTGTSANVTASGWDESNVSIPAALQTVLDTRLDNLQSKHGAEKLQAVTIRFLWQRSGETGEMGWEAHYKSVIALPSAGLQRHANDSGTLTIPPALLTWLSNRLDDIAAKHSAILQV